VIGSGFAQAPDGRLIVAGQAAGSYPLLDAGMIDAPQINGYVARVALPQ
jgi:hypothetical protein